MKINVVLWIATCCAQCPSLAFLNAHSSITKEIVSPGYPLKYSTYLRCTWRITAPFGYRVLLKFIDFDTYSYKSLYSGLCNSQSDNLEVYNGYDSSSSLLGKYCGPSKPASVVSTYTYLYLKFQSSYRSTSSSTKKGFKISYTAVRKPSSISSSMCSPYVFSATNQNIKLKSSNQTKYIESPLYPNAYPSNILCKWYISASKNRRIQLKISEAKVSSLRTSYCGESTYEKLQDFIKILDGQSIYSTTLKSICEPLDSPLMFTSTGESMTVYFKSNDDNYFSTAHSIARFKMEYREVDADNDDSLCSPYKTSYANNNLRVKASPTINYIKSPWYPGKYPTSIKCTWYIEASSGSKKIQLRMSNVKIYNRYSTTCSSYSFVSRDILKITDGSSTYSDDLKTVCSTLSSATVESTGRYMTVQFETDADDYFVGSSAGFELEFWEFEDDAGVGAIVGIVIAVIAGIGIIICCGVCICRSKGSSGHVQRVPTQSTATTTAISNPPTQQYPMQAQGGPPQAPAGSYPSQFGQKSQAYPMSGQAYPPHGQAYPPPGQAYPPPGQAYPPPSEAHPTPGQTYPPPGQSYPPPGQAYPPPGQAYLTPGETNPPPGQAYPPPVNYLPPVNDSIPSEPPPQYFSVVDPSQAPPQYNPQYQGASGTNPPYPTTT